MKIYKNLSQILTLESAHAKDGRNLIPDDLSLIENASVVFDENEILWVGETIDLPMKYLMSENIFDLNDHCLTPELVDCHTHLVFGGDRSKEYSMRLNGADYQEIASSGGGIIATMNATKKSNFNTLYNQAVKRIERIHSYGIGTIEIKSGYGLNFEEERELSLIIDKLKKHFVSKVQIKNTYMAAHAVPESFKNSADYIENMVIPLMKELSALEIIDAVDIFHEEGYFNESDVKLLFTEAQKLHLPVKTHSDEFKDNGGAALACSFNALSCDHLLMTGESGIKALSESQTVATLLPGTGFFLGKKQANARKLLDAGVKVAIGSDYNPGSCHFDNLLLIAQISAPTLNMNQAELWSSITLNSSHALGILDQGAIIKGMKPRFSLFKCKSIDQITYKWGVNLSEELI